MKSRTRPSRSTCSRRSRRPAPARVSMFPPKEALAPSSAARRHCRFSWIAPKTFAPATARWCSSRAKRAWANRGSSTSSAAGLSPMAFSWLTGRCISYGADIPYVPIVDLTKSACGIEESDPEAVIDAKLTERVETGRR